jgi:hypothetical protein
MFTISRFATSEIMGPTMKIKANVKLGSLTNESIIDDVSWNQLMSIKGDDLCVKIDWAAYVGQAKNHNELNCT